MLIQITPTLLLNLVKLKYAIATNEGTAVRLHFDDNTMLTITDMTMADFQERLKGGINNARARTE